MKRLLNISRCIAAIIAIMACAASCDTSYRHRGGPFSPEDGPNRPGTGGDEDVTTILNLEYGYGDFYGQHYKTKPESDNYLISLCAGETDEEGYFKKDGVILTLDLVSYRHGALALEEGTYWCSKEKGVMLFVPTYKSDDSDVDGSVLYIQRSKNDWAYHKITDGMIKITSFITGAYEIKGTIIAGGKEYEVNFEGVIDIVDHTKDNPGGDEPGDNPGDEPGEKPNFPAPEGSEWAAKAVYLGRCADNNNIDEYTLYLSLGEYAENGFDFKSSGTEIAIELLTTIGDGRSIPMPEADKVDVYTCTHDEAEAYRFYDGYESEGTMYPSYFYRQWSTKDGEYSLEAITNGTFKVSRGTNGGYKFDFIYTTASNTYKVSYDGAVKFEKAASQTKAEGLSARGNATGRHILETPYTGTAPLTAPESHNTSRHLDTNRVAR